MPCLSPSSPIIPATEGGRQVVVEAMHEVVIVNRELASRPVVELHVAAVCKANKPDALLRFSHRGVICGLVNRTRLWADAALTPSPDAKWYVEDCFFSSWQERTRPKRREQKGSYLWTVPNDGQGESVSVWPSDVIISEKPRYSPERDEALYSTFDVKFRQTGLQLLGFSFRTTHGITETGPGTCQVHVEGPGSAAEWLMAYVTTGENLSDDERKDLEKEVSSYWFAERCLGGDDVYSVVVMPHPRLRALPKWEIGSTYYPPPGRWLTVNVDGAPDDMAFAGPHSDSHAIGLYPTTRDFQLQIEHVMQPAAPSDTFREVMRIWKEILVKEAM